MSTKTKLTIHVEKQWVDKSRDYAARRGITITQLISTYLRHLSTQDEMLTDTPIFQRLSGVLPTDVIVDEYYEHLERKHKERTN
ncbi:MAG: hypothetical protein KKD28_06825 [Chloroflexi bacterium]|nr:hypothetical protein [Chloroflexota bacterium]MBU1661170.1 hypothetical protein [Chloroflexota bacterium]